MAVATELTSEADEKPTTSRSNLRARRVFATKTNGPKKLSAMIVKATNATLGAAGSWPGVRAIAINADIPTQNASVRVATAAGQITRAIRKLTFRRS